MEKEISKKDIEILQSIAENPKIAEQARQDARKLLREWVENIQPIQTETPPTQTEKPKNENAKSDDEKMTWQLAYQRYKQAKSPAGKAKYENVLLDAVRTGEPIPNNVLGELDSEKVQEAMQSFINLPTQTEKPEPNKETLPAKVPVGEHKVGDMEGTHKDYLEAEIEAFEIALELAESERDREYLESEIEAFKLALEIELESL